MSEIVSRVTGPRLRSALTYSLLLAGCTLNPDPGTSSFRDCAACPEMVSLPAGTFLMGTAEDDRIIDPRTGKPATNDGPQHEVTFAYPFAIGKFEVTIAEFAEFVAATGYATVDRCMEFSKPGGFAIRKDISWEHTAFLQWPNQPVVCVSFHDAEAYAVWLSEVTGTHYRLPTEAEWEYAARGGSTTPYFWGTAEADACDFANVRGTGADTISPRQAEADKLGFPCDDGFRQSSPAGSFRANAFGLHDMQGNVWEWVADCNHKDYEGAPTDGSAWTEADPQACNFGIIRGGSFLNLVERSSVTVRAGRPRSGSATNMGFRVVRDKRGTPERMATAQKQWRPGAAQDGDSAGAQLFSENCAACHLSSRDFAGLYGTSRTEVIAAISNGGNNTMSMPAFADRLTGTEIEELADYIRAVNDWR
ncbi:MAG: SUMF1/EgtB/PvdO family nonheme iron enzyme [Gammaproteobacteria bacterium]|nr:SUMF1/EgtB/PvdO family nonheme iron enzyme [Gammaproteobacteria bacterium]NND55396.1 SUMF1/EgtB/PvdO family nonheme iron enzyme [Gammaproteobacteria bacterium]